MDELDTQLAADLAAQKDEVQQVEPEAPQEPEVETKPEPKMFDEDYVKGLRAENAKYRRQLRDEQAKNQYTNPYAEPARPNMGYPQAGYPTQAPQEVYDPRVDDMILSNKMSEIKADPYFGELFNEVDDEGRTFEERLLEKAVETQWPIAELDALVFKMEKNKLIGKVKQKGIDEAYLSMKNKSLSAPERTVSSGKNAETGEINNVDDAIRAALRDNGITSLSELR